MGTLGRVKLSDLVPSEGIASDSYKLSVTTLSESLAQYSAAIIQFSASETALLRSGLDSARLYFHQRSSYPVPDMIHNNESREWCKTSGYYADPQVGLEMFDYRPGTTLLEPNNAMELPPGGLPDIFSLLGKAGRDILDAISFYLNLRSSPFTEILDNVPLRNREISSSVLSVCCHARPSFQGVEHHNLTAQEDGQLVMYPDHEHQTDKSLITLVKTDKEGLLIRDFHGRWVLVDGDLGPQEAIVYPGLALYQATAGYVNPALHRTEINNLQSNTIYGRCSLAFKLMPKSMTSFNCSEMRAAGHGVEAQFQIPVPVDDFMQRSHPTDQLFNRHSLQSFNFPPTQDGSPKPLMRRRKNNSRSKPLPPSKRLRLEAQRVLKEKVQDIADKKGIKLRFCNLKECENHIHALDSPCSAMRMEIGWPPGVPFVHPHDLPNKAKIGFLEAYEPGWTASHGTELSLTEPVRASQHSANCNFPPRAIQGQEFLGLDLPNSIGELVCDVLVLQYERVLKIFLHFMLARVHKEIFEDIWDNTKGCNVVKEYYRNTIEKKVGKWLECAVLWITDNSACTILHSPALSVMSLLGRNVLSPQTSFASTWNFSSMTSPATC